ncbi:MAG: hypothetical protein KDC90_18925 [Ignavibacteriae bacterium]|nr:hypothetical protein [Ignavibacteriota bacterium]
MSLSKDDIALIAKEVALQIGAQDFKQIGQQGGQQISDQIEKGISQAVEAAKQTVQGTQQEKASFVSEENKFEETYVGEAFQNKAYNDGEMWTVNKKLITEREQKAALDANAFDLKLKNLELKEKELAVAEREAKLRHQTKLDSIEVNERNNLATITHLANTLLVDFRTAAYHPISPNNSDEGVQGGDVAAARVSRK